MPRRAAALIFLLYLSVACGSAPKPFVARPSRQPVVVAIVVDQLAAWIADSRLETLPRTGGFARLRREGIWYKQARFNHAVTDTGPGHAALYTGTPPRESGIWANDRIAADGAPRSIFEDPLTQLVTPTGLEGIGSSPRPLRRPTVADQLIEARPGAVVASISLKDRSAILGGGRRAQLVLWFDRTLDSFVTSTAYALRLPAWVGPIAGPQALARLRRDPWVPLDPAWLEANARVPDAGPDEGNLDGFGIVFPHRVVTSTNPARVFRASPYGDQAVIEVALAAIERMPNPDAPFFLALGLSATDYIGHIFGPDSRESWDNLYRLDGQLARLFAALDRRFGPAGWSAVLSADHGATHLGGHRVLQRPLAAKLESAAEEAFGKGPWILGVKDPYVELTARARALSPDLQEALYDKLEKTLLAEPGVVAVRDLRKPAAGCPPDSNDSLEAMICRSLPSTRQSMILVLLGGDAFWDYDLVVGKGGNHGTASLDDRTVPILVRAPGRIEGGTIVAEPVPAQRFYATLLDLLGLSVH